ncbi:MAG: anaerobic glycerol-3-phosphate dehydrogenase subunit GlpB [Desulfocucumaceae bacterium]
MLKKTDVLVIGAGLSGIMAAAAAAEGGKKVLMAARGLGAVGLSSGCIDLWGYSPDHPEAISKSPMADIARVIELNPDHPYSRVYQVLGESLGFFMKVCSDSGIPYLQNGGKNWLVPTALGTVRPTYLAPASMAVDSLKHFKKIVVVGFRELKDFYPQVLAANLRINAGLHTDCVIETVTVSCGGGELIPNTLAYRLDSPGIINKIINEILPIIAPGSAVLFPPVLGERWDSGIARALGEGLGCPVYEVAGIPSLPGQRLQKALLHFLKDRGVEVIVGCAATGAHLSGGRCHRVTAVGGGQPLQISAGSYVLATGSFVGGGLEASPGGIREAVFNLPVKAGAAEWSEKDYLSMKGHSFCKFGIAVNDRLQPVDGQGRVLVDNLAVAGSNLYGCNHPVEKCGNGVALATGYLAGKLAGRCDGE